MVPPVVAPRPVVEAHRQDGQKADPLPASITDHQAHIVPRAVVPIEGDEQIRGAMLGERSPPTIRLTSWSMQPEQSCDP